MPTLLVDVQPEQDEILAPEASEPVEAEMYL